MPAVASVDELPVRMNTDVGGRVAGGETRGNGRNRLNQAYLPRLRTEMVGREARLPFVNDEDVGQARMKRIMSGRRIGPRPKNFGVRESARPRTQSIDVNKVPCPC